MAELQATMSVREFVSWQEFYTETPFDDHHRYHRPAAMVAQSLGGGKIQDRLDFLVPPVQNEDYSQADLNTLKALGATPPQK